MEKSLKIDSISKHYGDLLIFMNFSAEFHEKKVNCILGPSGCGKTSLLNILGGLLKPDSGNLGKFTGMSVSYVFQEPRLLPWKTVEGNIRFVLEGKLPKYEIEERVKENLEKVELTKFREYYPGQLSGGMKQRVALARAYAADTELILMDEPFKALDAKLKNTLMEKLLTLRESDPRTVVFVSHELEEVLKIGHRLMVFSEAPVRILKEYELTGNSLQKLREEIGKIILPGESSENQLVY